MPDASGRERHWVLETFAASCASGLESTNRLWSGFFLCYQGYRQQRYDQGSDYSSSRHVSLSLKRFNSLQTCTKTAMLFCYCPFALRVAHLDSSRMKRFLYAVRVRGTEQGAELSLQNMGCRTYNCHRNYAIGIVLFQRSYLP